MAQKTQWTAATRAAFIASLAECGEVRAALNTVGLSPKSAYRLRALDPDFARAWDAALLHSRQAVVAELTSRALHGWQEEVWFRGELVGTRTRHDNRLLLALLARLDAAAGKDNEARVRRAASHFADVLAAMEHDMPLAPWFAATLAEKQEDAIDQACRRQRFWHYAALMDEEQIDDVMGFGPDHDAAYDDAYDDEYEDSNRDALITHNADAETGDGNCEQEGVKAAGPTAVRANADALGTVHADAPDLMPSPNTHSAVTDASLSRGCYPVLPMAGQSLENLASAGAGQQMSDAEARHRPMPPQPDQALGPLSEVESEAMEGDMAQLFQQRFAAVALATPFDPPP